MPVDATVPRVVPACGQMLDKPKQIRAFIFALDRPPRRIHLTFGRKCPVVTQQPMSAPTPSVATWWRTSLGVADTFAPDSAADNSGGSHRTKSLGRASFRVSGRMVVRQDQAKYATRPSEALRPELESPLHPKQ